MSRGFSPNVQDAEEELDLFEKNFIEELGKKYRHARRNGYSTDFEIEDFKNIKGFDASARDKFLDEIQRDRHSIIRLPENKACLSPSGEKYCMESNQSTSVQKYNVYIQLYRSTILQK